MSEPAHSVRNSLIDQERSFSLGADALNWRDAAGEGRMAYADVRDMRLIGYTSLIGEARQCTLRGHRGGRVKIRSAHYRGLGNFEDRTEGRRARPMRRRSELPLDSATVGVIDYGV